MSTTRSSIEWTDATWNPVRGCALVSPGCANCYAMKQAHRFSGKGQPYAGFTKLRAKSGPVWTGNARFIPEALAEPLRWRAPKKVFVNSMSDLFHEDVTNEQIAAVFNVMAAATHHTFQVLTKRAERMREWFDWLKGQAEGFRRRYPNEEEHGLYREALIAACLKVADAQNEGCHGWPLPNVWLGVSVENQKCADERIPQLLRTPAAVRFVSAEPLLEGVDLTDHIGECFGDDGEMPGVDWVIVGGESGPGARPFCLSWALNIVADCDEAGVPCFVKQLGRRPYRVREDVEDLAIFYEDDVAEWLTLKDRKGGDPAGWPAFLRRREFPTKEASR